MTNKDKIKVAVSFALKQCYGVFIYETFDNKMVLEYVSNSRIEFLNYLKENLDWSDIDLDTCKLLGFCKWADEDPNFYLIPHYLYPIIPVGLKVKSISGGIHDWTGREDRDSRFGCLAYGIEVKND